MSINLLPGQSKLDNRRHLIFSLSLEITVGLAIVLVGLAGFFWYSAQVIKKDITLKAAEKKELMEEISPTKEQEDGVAMILDRRETVNRLELTKQQQVKITDHIAGATPASLQINQLFFEKTNNIKIAGRATQRADISQFVDQLEKIRDLSEVALSQTDTQNDGVHFTITVKIQEKK